MSEYSVNDRLTAPELAEQDHDIEVSLRPRTLDQYIGQDKAKENLSIYIEAAKIRNEPLDHVLIYGPPGLGKTTLAGIIANEMGVNLRVTSGPAIERQGDLASLLMGSCQLEGMLRLGAASADNGEAAQQLSRLLHYGQKPWLNSDY